MVNRSVRIRLEDIVENVDGACALVAGMSFADYQANFGVRKAVERVSRLSPKPADTFPTTSKTNIQMRTGPKFGASVTCFDTNISVLTTSSCGVSRRNIFQI